MKKLSIMFVLFFSLFLTSCGALRGVNGDEYIYNGVSWPEESLPITLKVPKEYYEKYQKQFNKVEGEYHEAAGKDLVNFVPSDENYQLEEYSDARKHWRDLESQGEIKKGEYIVYIKDDKENFKDVPSNVINMTLGYGSTNWNWNKEITWGAMNLNLYIIQTSATLEYTLRHELGHFLGFPHIEDELSWMNPAFAGPFPNGFVNNDIERIHERYLHFIRQTYGKDLEKIGYNEEKKIIDIKAQTLQERFGLSDQRSQHISKIIYHFNMIKNKRAVSEKDYDLISKKLLGVHYKDAKTALEFHLQGESERLNELLEVAAEVNETTPEHITEILEELF